MKFKVGDRFPRFTLLDQHGNLFQSDSVIGKKVTVLYFYPKNFTPGCKKEACHFRDTYEAFKELGAEVIGVSSDSVKSHRKFSETYDLPFVLLSDPTEHLRQQLGIKTHFLGMVPGRETWVIDENKIIRLKFHQLGISQHVEKAMTVVKQLNDKG